MESLVPMIVMTGMFAMILGIVYLRSRENLALIEKGINPKQQSSRPRPFVNLKWGLLLMGSGIGLLTAYLLDTLLLPHPNKERQRKSVVITKMGTDTSHIDTLCRHNSGSNIVLNSNGLTIKGDLDQLAADADAGNTKADAGKGSANEKIEIMGSNNHENEALYFALVAIGGGIGLFRSYRIEKKDWQDKGGGNVSQA